MVGLVDELAAAVDVVGIDLVGTFLVNQLLGTARAELLGFVAVNDEERRLWVLANGLADAAIEEIVGLFDSGVEVGFRVHQRLVERYAEGLFGVGEELKVDNLVGEALAVGVGRCQVGVFGLIESVLGVVVAEIVF